MKILIILFYYERPILVKNALRSLKEADKFYQNWELAAIDDGSTQGKELRPILDNFFPNDFRIKHYYNEKKQEGQTFAAIGNQSIMESDADIAIFLCDDDELYPKYLHGLNQYFIENSEVKYSYCYLNLYNPLIEDSIDVDNYFHYYNSHPECVTPQGSVDYSQVSWRLECNKKHNIWMPIDRKAIEEQGIKYEVDFLFFQSLFEKFGPCCWNNLIGQYKAQFDLVRTWGKYKHPGFDYDQAIYYLKPETFEEIYDRYLDQNNFKGAIKVLEKSLEIFRKQDKMNMCNKIEPILNILKK